MEEEAKKRDEKLKMELNVFWKDVLILMRQPPDESKLHDVARLLYVVKESIIPETLEDTENKVRQHVILNKVVYY